ncbi:MAG: DUF5686 and carboxypeptidase regulatory-like domain-containing protein [Spirosomaceae bacterium]|nr:DUF5686 and carboxypeptidase regulatory-like domain-containing protein [Spirosomataceae bacterium]
MNKKLFLLTFFLPFITFSQNFFTLRGYIYAENNEPISGASIRVFNLNTGTMSNPEGRYEIRLIEGLNRITVTSVGYQPETFEVVVEKDFVKNVILKIDQKHLEEVVVKVKKRDYSYEVIKKVIENKQNVLNQFTNFKCETYIKSVEHLEKKLTPKADSLAKKDSLPRMNLFECKLIRHENSNGQQKEEKLAVKTVGEQRTLFFRSVTDGEFNLYKNHQRIEKIGQNEYLSPLSDLTFLSYKFQLLKYYYEGNEKIYRIKVTPRELGNALYEGEIEVIEDLWVLKTANLNLTKRGLLVYDSFGFKQEFTNIQNRWVPSKTTYHWKLKEGGSKKTGEAVVIQSNYEFDVNLPKRFFGLEVGRTTEDAYKRDSTFWESIRPQPLTNDEMKVIKEKERLELLKNSKAYLDSIDRIFNKITFQKVLYQGIGHINRAKKVNWSFDPVLGLFDPVTIGGLRVRYGIGYFKKFENKKTLDITVSGTYGFLNRDLKGRFSINSLYNPKKLSSVTLQMGSGFGVINGAATVRDIARRSNFYQNNFILAGHRTELFNGFYINTNLFYEKRFDLSNFKFAALGDRLFTENKVDVFPTSYTYKAIFDIEYTPRQLFLREPDQKIILGSRFPTFNARIERAFSVRNRPSNQFTYFSFEARQEFNVGIFGTSEYKIKGGKFLDTTSLAPMDYKYMRGGDPYFFSPPMYTYQLIPETFTVFNWFFESHYTHQFNGYLTSKIPLLNKTGIKEMAGGGFLYVPERKYQYAELYGGINRIFKVGRERFRLGVYYVVAQSNDFGIRNMIKFSFEPYNQYRNTWSF